MRIVLSLVVVIGICIGAAIGWSVGGRQSSKETLLELYVSLQGDTEQIGTMDQGWGPSTTRGSPLANMVASLVVPTNGLAKKDYVVDIETAGERPRGEQPLRVGVSVDGQDIGTFVLGASRVKRMLLPVALLSPGTPLKFTFKSSTRPTDSVSISSLTLRDLSTLQEFAGNLDVCAGTHIHGWAKAGKAPAPIIVRRDGIRTLFVLPSVDRPDLPAAGMPIDAGFEVTLKDPIKPGEKVEVLLSNGKPLGGAECKA